MLSRLEECRQKHQIVKDYLQKHGLEAVILTRRCNFAWFTAGGLNHVGVMSEVGAASLLITPDRVLCITNTIEAGRIVAEELGEVGIEVRAYDWWDSAAGARLWADELGQRPAAWDEPVPMIGRTLPTLDGGFAALRYQLNAAEIERYRAAARDTGLALEAACRQARPGMTEYELGARLAVELGNRDLRMSVCLMANEERVRRFRHPLPTAAKFTRYGMAVCGGERHGLFTSVTRFFSFGPIDADLHRRHEAVCTVDTAMIAATRPGATLGDILAAGQRTYAATGFADEWKLHHQGGSTGYRPREAYATPGNAERVLVNQAYAWNPSITGAKSEDTIVVSPERNELISLTGEWPTKVYTAGGLTLPRNEILEL